MFLGFAGLITGVAVWSIWGQDMFPKPEEPKSKPEEWSDEQLLSWLKHVGFNRGSSDY